jgi:hypothetical protein
MKLYEIANDYLALLEAIENGEIPEEAIADTLEAITGDIEVKADDIACLLKNIEADVLAIKAEETKLAERRKQKEREYEKIKDYLSCMLQKVGCEKVETARNKITFRKSESVEVSEGFMTWAKEYRDDLLKYGEPTANKTAIKHALKCGAEIIGARIVVNQNIQLK